MKYITYIKPPKELIQFSEDFTNKYANRIRHNTILGLHCTLRVGRFDKKFESRMYDVLKEIEFEPFNISLDGMVELFHPDAVVMKVSKDNNVQTLHQKILDKLEPYHNREEHDSTVDGFNDSNDRSEVIAKYSSPFVAEFYEPHITLCYMHEPHLPNLSRFKGLTWKVDGFHFARKEDTWHHIGTIKL
tara:strand:- start:28851 stop:29414 length:564 start_codon:yes stop_codon:yes gene_type:complete